MNYKFDEERYEFEKYLMSTFNYSKKAAKDCASRCKRIERDIASDLSSAVSDVVKFERLISQIQSYAITVRDNKKSAYSLAGSLRAAAKKYACYLYPERAVSYPAAHGKSKYI